MGHLVMAEALVDSRRFVAAQRHLVTAKTLGSQIEHRYVEDRRAAVETLMPEILVLGDLKTKELSKAEDRVLGWFIEHRTSKTSINQVAEELGIDRKRVKAYLVRLASSENEHSPYRHQTKIRNAYKKRRPVR